MRIEYLTHCIAITLAAVTVTPIATVRGQPARDDLANGFTVVPLLRGALIPTVSAWSMAEPLEPSSPTSGSYATDPSLPSPTITGVTPTDNAIILTWTNALAPKNGYLIDAFTDLYRIDGHFRLLDPAARGTFFTTFTPDGILLQTGASYEILLFGNGENGLSPGYVHAVTKLTTPTITIGDPSSNATWSPVAVQAFAIWDFSGSGIVQGASGSGGVFPRFQSSSGAQPVVRQGNQFDRGRGGLRANIVIGYFFNESDKPRFVAFHLFIDPKTNNAVPISVLYGDARADVPGTLVWVGLVADFPPLQITNGDAVLNTPNIVTGRVGGTTLAADGTNRVVDFTFHLALVRQ